MFEFIAGNWFLNAILVTLGIGLVAFISKVFAERKYEQNFVALMSYALLSIYALVYVVVQGWTPLTPGQYLLAILFGAQLYLYSIIMIVTLRYLPTSTFFVSVRLISSFTLLLIGVLAFGDHIGSKEAVGFLLGVVAMILLFEREEKEGLDYRKGSILLGVGALALVFGHTVSKVFSLSIETVPTVLFISFLGAFVVGIPFTYKNFRSNLVHFKPIFYFNLVQTSLAFFYFVMLFEVYRLGDLGISYKIQSYSPFIPIILASLIYHEKISTKKKIALVLVAISLWFFY